MKEGRTSALSQQTNTIERRKASNGNDVTWLDIEGW